MKNNKIKFIICVFLITLFTSIGGICLSNLAIQIANLKMYEDLVSKTQYFGNSFTAFPNDHYYLDLDAKIKATGKDNYLGYFSPYGATTAKLNYNGKGYSVPTCIPSGTVDISVYTKKQANVVLGENEYAVYCAGWELENIKIGDKFTLDLTMVDNSIKVVNAVKVGSCSLEQVYTLMPSCAAVYRSQIVIEGFDIHQFVENPYATVAYLDKDGSGLGFSMLDILKDCKIGSINISGWGVIPPFEIKFLSWSGILSMIVGIALIFIIKGKTRFLMYGLSIISYVVAMLVARFTSGNKLLYFFEKNLNASFCAVFFIGLGAIALIALINLLVIQHKSKINSFNEVEYDRTPKYL
ncbi:MAG: hypothetical protein RR357_05080 [Clostridia bacterium]